MIGLRRRMTIQGMTIESFVWDGKKEDEEHLPEAKINTFFSRSALRRRGGRETKTRNAPKFGCKKGPGGIGCVVPAYPHSTAQHTHSAQQKDRTGQDRIG
jgi:hypothetical protein